MGTDSLYVYVRFRLLYHFTFSRFTFRTKLGILIRCDVD